MFVWLQNGKTEYKSLTINPDATAEEFMDMYLDDDNRPNWVRVLKGCFCGRQAGALGPRHRIEQLADQAGRCTLCNALAGARSLTCNLRECSP